MVPPNATTNPIGNQLALVLPRPIGGVAPSRREVALMAHLEAQAAARRRATIGQTVMRVTRSLMRRAMGLHRGRAKRPAAAYAWRSVRL